MKRIEKRMASLAALALAFTAGTGHANNAAVLVEADKDTVTKFIYVGSSPNNTTHPAVSVEGKARGLAAKAQATDGSAALIGEVSGYALPNPGAVYSTAGVIGSGDYGVMGKGTNAGLHGDGGVGVVGSGATGVAGNGANIGVMGTTTASGGYAVWGNASGSNTRGVFGEGVTGVYGKSVTSGGIGVHGETTSGTGVKGTGQSYGVHATISGGGSWPTGLRAETGSATNGNGVYATGGVGVYAYGYYNGVEANGGQYGSGIYASGGDYSGFFDGDVYVNGVVHDGSDLALKENVRPLSSGLNTVLSLKPKAYEMKPGVTAAKHKGTRFGLVAQEVQSVMPEVVRSVKMPVRRNAEGVPDMNAPRPEYLAVNYTSLIPVLIKAIQEQQARIEALEAGRR